VLSLWDLGCVYYACFFSWIEETSPPKISYFQLRNLSTGKRWGLNENKTNQDNISANFGYWTDIWKKFRNMGEILVVGITGWGRPLIDHKTWGWGILNSHSFVFFSFVLVFWWTTVVRVKIFFLKLVLHFLRGLQWCLIASLYPPPHTASFFIMTTCFLHKTL
jgi:hypothetical protein